jgi:hypothetical protein
MNPEVNDLSATEAVTNLVMHFYNIDINNIKIGEADSTYQMIPIEYYNPKIGKCHPLYIQVHYENHVYNI